MKMEKEAGGEPIVRGGVELRNDVVVPLVSVVAASGPSRTKGLPDALSPPLVLR